MQSYNLLSQIDKFSRPIYGLVETLSYFHPEIGVSCIRFPHKSEYACLIWDDPKEKAKFAKSKLEQLRLKYTIEMWTIQLMEEANQLQRAALALHTISRNYALTQKNMYDIKYEASIKYVSSVEEWLKQNSNQGLPSAEQIEVPPAILNESSKTGDPPYYLCLAIIQNYIESQDTLSAFYGQVEGERRVTKARIKNCKSIEELKQVQWANWPNYVGNPPAPTD